MIMGHLWATGDLGLRKRLLLLLHQQVCSLARTRLSLMRLHSTPGKAPRRGASHMQ